MIIKTLTETYSEMTNNPVSIKINESQSQEIGSFYDKFSKEHNIDLDKLVYGEDGFMKTCYPDDFPDFAGDVIYSEKYWNEFEKWLKDVRGINLDESLNEDKKDVTWAVCYRDPERNDKEIIEFTGTEKQCDKHIEILNKESEAEYGRDNLDTYEYYKKQITIYESLSEELISEGHYSQTEVKEIIRLCNQIGIKTLADLKAFNEENPGDLLTALTDFKNSLGKNFRLPKKERGLYNEGLTNGQLMIWTKGEAPEYHAEWIDIPNDITLDDFELLLLNNGYEIHDTDEDPNEWYWFDEEQDEHPEHLFAIELSSAARWWQFSSLQACLDWFKAGNRNDFKNCNIERNLDEALDEMIERRWTGICYYCLREFPLEELSSDEKFGHHICKECKDYFKKHPDNYTESLNETIEKQPDVEYKGFTIEHFPMHWESGEQEFDTEGWIIHAPGYFVDNDKRFPLPLRCHQSQEDDVDKSINFKTVEEAKAWIDEFGDNYETTIEHGDEIHAWPKEVNEELVNEENLEETFAIDYCKNDKNVFPAKNFIETQTPKVKEKLYSNIELLRKLGYNARRPLVDKLEGDIYELRTKFRHDQYRILYFFFNKKTIVFTHGFIKNTDAVPENEIIKALRLERKYLKEHK